MCFRAAEPECDRITGLLGCHRKTEAIGVVPACRIQYDESPTSRVRAAIAIGRLFLHTFRRAFEIV